MSQLILSFLCPAIDPSIFPHPASDSSLVKLPQVPSIPSSTELVHAVYCIWIARNQIEQKQERRPSCIERAIRNEKKKRKSAVNVCRVRPSEPPYPKTSAGVNAKAKLKRQAAPSPESSPFVQYPEWSAPTICTTKAGPASRHASKPTLR